VNWKKLVSKKTINRKIRNKKGREKDLHKFYNPVWKNREFRGKVPEEI
jgi:hypothetical protein